MFVVNEHTDCSEARLKLSPFAAMCCRIQGIWGPSIILLGLSQRDTPSPPPRGVGGGGPAFSGKKTCKCHTMGDLASLILFMAQTRPLKEGRLPSGLFRVIM